MLAMPNALEPVAIEWHDPPVEGPLRRYRRPATGSGSDEGGRGGEENVARWRAYPLGAGTPNPLGFRREPPERQTLATGVRYSLPAHTGRMGLVCCAHACCPAGYATVVMV